MKNQGRNELFFKLINVNCNGGCGLMYNWFKDDRKWKDDRKFKTTHSATFKAYLTFSIIHCGYLEIIKYIDKGKHLLGV